MQQTLLKQYTYLTREFGNKNASVDVGWVER